MMWIDSTLNGFLESVLRELELKHPFEFIEIARTEPIPFLSRLKLKFFKKEN